MAQRHMDRLTSFDTSFLANEKANGHMAIGALLMCEGSAPDAEDFLAHIRSRVHQLPRLRQRLLYPPLGLGTPFWVDYPDFDIHRHVRRASLPAPGSEGQFRDLVGELLAPPLDRSKPLWELILVEGFEDDRFGIVYKTHHAMADGISAVDIGMLLFDAEPKTEPAREEAPWEPARAPSRIGLLGRGGHRGRRHAGPPRPLAAPRRTGPEAGAQARRGRVHRPLGGDLEPGPAGAEGPLQHRDRAGPELLVGPISAWPTSSTSRTRSAAPSTTSPWRSSPAPCGAGCSNAGLAVDGLELKALVPVSIRTENEHGELGNKLTAMRGPLPVGIEDPAERLAAVSAAMDALKASKQPLGAEAIWGLNDWFRDFAPPVLLAPTAAINFSTRLFNLLVTNFPGPQVPFYVLGRELTAVYPIGFLARRHALAIAILSYNGQVGFGPAGRPRRAARRRAARRPTSRPPSTS